MKKINYLVLLLIMVFEITLNAQKVEFGTVTGLNIANAFITENLGSRRYYPMLTYNLNGYVKYKFKNPIALSIEPGIVRKGGFNKQWNDEYKEVVEYINIPFLVHYEFNEKWSISLGAEYNKLIKGFFNEPKYDNLTEKCENHEYALLAGVNYKIIKWISIGFRYNQGITYSQNIEYYEISSFEPVAIGKVYNINFQLLLVTHF